MGAARLAGLMSRRKVTTANAVAAIAVLLAVAGLFAIASGIAPLLTTDQRGYRLYADAAYTEAANRFSDPLWAGIALYRAREFEQAAGVFAGIDTAIAAFNRGNSFRGCARQSRDRTRPRGIAAPRRRRDDRWPDRRRRFRIRRG